MRHFKPGDRVVVVGSQWVKDGTYFVEFADHGEPDCDYSNAFIDGYWIESECVVPEHIYNSRLYKALQED